MTRLKIVDQSDIKVPYDFSEQLGVVLAFNGEIYNVREVMKASFDAIRDRGEIPPVLVTSCDAEVVALAWRAFGEECLHRFNGMWALVLLDVRDQVLFVARDRAGEKPLYRAEREGTHYFASEIKAFPFELEETECPDVSALEFDSQRATPFLDVYNFEPGGRLVARSPAALEEAEERWWELPRNSDPTNEQTMDIPDAVQELKELVVDAIRIRVPSEVGWGVQLSGGLDSAIIQSVVRCPRTYCVDFRAERVDNLTRARAAARGSIPRPVSFRQKDLERVLPLVAYYLDTPATWTAVCQWFLLREIARDGNRVSLSGEGADELFGGYSRYRVLYWLDRMRQDGGLEAYMGVVRKMIGQDIWAPTGRNAVVAKMLNRGCAGDLPKALALVERHSGDHTGLVDKAARTDFYTTMQVLLRMADRMSSAWSVESRAPFLDYRVMEAAAKMSSRSKINECTSKLGLVRVGALLGVPRSILTEKTKKGLFIPPTWGPPRDQLWDRTWFADMMKRAWREAFSL